MNDVWLMYILHAEVFVAHVHHLIDGHGRLVAVRIHVVKEELEVAHDHKLALPSFFDSSGLWHLK